MLRRFLSVTFLVIILVSGTIPASAQDTTESSPVNPATSFRPMNEMLLDVAKEVPGFGGMFLNRDEDVLYVYSVNNSDTAAYQRRIAAVFGQSRIPNGGIRLIPGKYPLKQLADWYGPMRNNLLGMDWNREW